MIWPRSRVIRKSRPEQSLRGCCSQAHDQFGLDALDFGLEPGKASSDLARARFRVQASFAARSPFEVLHDVRHVGGLAFDSDFGESFVQQLPGRADKRPAGEVFLVAGCFTHEHQPGMCRPFAEDRLGCVSKELASLASLGGGPKLLQATGLGHEWVGGWRLHVFECSGVAAGSMAARVRNLLAGLCSSLRIARSRPCKSNAGSL